MSNIKYKIVWDRDLKDYYGTNCNCVIEEKVVEATFDTEEAAIEYIEACKTKAYRDNPNLYIGWADERRGKSYYYRRSPLGHVHGKVRIEEVPGPPPHNPPIDWK